MPMRSVRSFRDLIVWQRSVGLAVAVYELTREFPKEEIYGLTSQLRRAAVSIASNIAEGHGRNTAGEFRQFLGVARGSNFEVQTQLVLSRRLKYGSAERLTLCEGLSVEVEKMLVAFAATISRIETDSFFSAVLRCLTLSFAVPFCSWELQ
jgi:four helix bundle protein